MQEKTSVVVITGCRYLYMWYKNKIGEQFQVLEKEFDANRADYIYWVRTDDELPTKNFIHATDCEEISMSEKQFKPMIDTPVEKIKTPPWPELKWPSADEALLPASFYRPYEESKDTSVNDNGGKKFDDGKLRYDLIPPKALDQVVKALTHGANKYGDNNWVNVEDFRYDAAHGRHYAAWKLGEKYDAESKAHHLAAAVCNLMFLLEKELEKKEE